VWFVVVVYVDECELFVFVFEDGEYWFFGGDGL